MLTYLHCDVFPIEFRINVFHINGYKLRGKPSSPILKRVLVAIAAEQ